MMRMLSRKRRAGNAFIEFGLSATVLTFCLAGVYQFSYSMYIYNRLESAVNGAARFASYRTYRTMSTASDLAKNKTAVRNYAVYGSPTASGPALIPGLTPAHFDVDYTLSSGGVPVSVRVRVNEFKVDAIFRQFTFKGKPAVSYPYLGRYAPNESEP